MNFQCTADTEIKALAHFARCRRISVSRNNRANSCREADGLRPTTAIGMRAPSRFG
jgi:hypothetical protein